jgi:hypothetical protein
MPTESRSRVDETRLAIQLLPPLRRHWYGDRSPYRTALRSEQCLNFPGA